MNDGQCRVERGRCGWRGSGCHRRGGGDGTAAGFIAHAEKSTRTTVGDCGCGGGGKAGGRGCERGHGTAAEDVVSADKTARTAVVSIVADEAARGRGSRGPPPRTRLPNGRGGRYLRGRCRTPLWSRSHGWPWGASSQTRPRKGGENGGRRRRRRHGTAAGVIASKNIHDCGHCHLPLVFEHVHLWTKR